MNRKNWASNKPSKINKQMPHGFNLTTAARLFPSFQSFYFEGFSRLGKVRHKTDDKKYNR